MTSGRPLSTANILCLIFLAVNALTDLKARRIWWPGCMIGACAGLFLRLSGGMKELPAVFPGILSGLLPGAVMGVLSFLFQEAVGFGDAMVVMACGIMTGPETVLGMLSAALLLAGFFALFLLVIRKRSRKDSFPFVPFLLAGLILTELFG